MSQFHADILNIVRGKRTCALRALPLTASLCAAVAARIEGSIVSRVARRECGDRLRLAMPSGVLTVGAQASCDNGAWHVASGSFYRTARRLFEGCVYV